MLRKAAVHIFVKPCRKKTNSGNFAATFIDRVKIYFKIVHKTLYSQYFLTEEEFIFIEKYTYLHMLKSFAILPGSPENGVWMQDLTTALRFISCLNRLFKPGKEERPHRLATNITRPNVV